MKKRSERNHNARYLNKRRHERQNRARRRRLANIALYEETLRTICETFPECFSLGALRAPLKIDIRHDLIRALPDIPEKQICGALAIYTDDLLAYRANFLLRAIRRDLQGKPCGEVSIEAAEHAGLALLDAGLYEPAAEIARSVAARLAA